MKICPSQGGGLGRARSSGHGPNCTYLMCILQVQCIHLALSVMFPKASEWDTIMRQLLDNLQTFIYFFVSYSYFFPPISVCLANFLLHYCTYETVKILIFNSLRCIHIVIYHPVGSTCLFYLPLLKRKFSTCESRIEKKTCNFF